MSVLECELFRTRFAAIWHSLSSGNNVVPDSRFSLACLLLLLLVFYVLLNLFFFLPSSLLPLLSPALSASLLPLFLSLFSQWRWLDLRAQAEMYSRFLMFRKWECMCVWLSREVLLNILVTYLISYPFLLFWAFHLRATFTTMLFKTFFFFFMEVKEGKSYILCDLWERFRIFGI